MKTLLLLTLLLSFNQSWADADAKTKQRLQSLNDWATQARQVLLTKASCSNKKTFLKNFDKTENEIFERFQSINDDDLDQLVETDQSNGAHSDFFEISRDYFAMQLPDHFPGVKGYQECALEQNGIHEALKQGDSKRAETSYKKWKSCLTVGYAEHLPTELQQLVDCYGTLIK